MEALGRIIDIGTGWAPVDINTADGATGKRIAMSQADAITFLVFCGAGGAEDLVLDVQQHTAYTGGTSSDLDPAATQSAAGGPGTTAPDHFYIKAETLLDNDEQWAKITQTAASELTVVGATYGALQKIIVIEINGAMMGDGYSHLSLNATCSTATAQLSSCVYLLHELRYQRKPANLSNLLRPGAVNA